ncbi:HigA family addiction module antitoxin [Candidatus Contubernalis alkaliaceticus]|uniref:HigA family addiction module antitoxin n=2 Tax=Candidatus Contubernalis alkaliaceticus TaxID=338645 RepID=UPI001F4BF1C9|nr:HigA family addiction module antitoxin [Candidatus Contubernalis alkalaceticus]UNC93529.1 HigA family addiction module antidote protein [Candidatus Contubernalis alkalaceticus]
MVNKKEGNQFLPTVAIPPGETIKENMKYLGMNQKELAMRLEITPKHLSNIVNGHDPITYDTALKLETVLGPKAHFWMNLETNYQLHKARLKKDEEFKADLEILKKIPYKQMSDFRWVESTQNRNFRVKNSREFFGVASLKAVDKSVNAMFRKQKPIKDISDIAVAAWLRKAVLEGTLVEVEKFDQKKLKSFIPRFRELTMKEPEDFYPEMQKLCADCGVALVLVKSLPKSYVCGATVWRRNKVILALSVRGKRADIFWFTFFHELAHLINHSKKESRVSYENHWKEDEADKKASDYLISNEQYERFKKEYDYTNKEQIIDYAHEIGIAPCILVGRLLHEGLLKYEFYSDLRPSFEIIN